jgi:hypothetical protein
MWSSLKHLPTQGSPEQVVAGRSYYILSSIFHPLLVRACFMKERITYLSLEKKIDLPSKAL